MSSRPSEPEASVLSQFYRGVYRLILPPDAFRPDPTLDALVSDLCRGATPRRPVLNLGSGRTRLGASVVNLDIQVFSGVAVCGDAERLPFADGVFAGVLLRGVFEHVRNAELVRAEVARVLAASGFIYVEVPFLQPFHASPGDYRRFTLAGLRAFLFEFTEAAAGVQIGPCSALAWVARETLASFFCFGSSWLYPKVLITAAWATFWLKYLDRFVAPAPHVANAASAVYYLGRKRG